MEYISWASGKTAVLNHESTVQEGGGRPVTNLLNPQSIPGGAYLREGGPGRHESHRCCCFRGNTAGRVPLSGSSNVGGNH